MSNEKTHLGEVGITRRRVLQATIGSVAVGGAVGVLSSPVAARRVKYNPDPTVTLDCDSEDPLEACISVSGRLTGLGNTDIIGWLTSTVEVEQQCVTRGNGHHPPGQPESTTETVTDAGVVTPENGNATFNFEICVPNSLETLDCSGGHDLVQTVTFERPTLKWDLDIDENDLDNNGVPIIDNLEPVGRLNQRFSTQTCPE